MSPNERIIRLPQVLESVGLKKSAIYKRIKSGEFPAPIKLGKHASGWLESAIQQWIKKQSGAIPANDEQHTQAA